MEYEWGPWIEHDGMGCPVKPGETVMIEVDTTEAIKGGIRGVYGPFVIDFGPISVSLWNRVDYEARECRFHGIIGKGIIRYRVRRPRVAEWLQSIPVDIKEPVDA
jgi:hypothetical protein